MSDTRALLAEGRLVTLAGGETRRLQLSNRMAAKIEVRYGSIVAYMRQLREAYFVQLGVIFSLSWGIAEEEAIDLVDPRRIGEYLEAVAEVLREFMGWPEEDQGEGQGQEGQSSSPGDVSMPSPSSTVISAPGASGTR